MTETAWTHLGIFAPIFATVIAIWWDLRNRQKALHEQTRREREAEAKQVADAIKERDRQMLFTLTEYPLHRHDEDADADPSEPLTTKGLKYPKLKIDKT